MAGQKSKKRLLTRRQERRFLRTKVRAMDFERFSRFGVNLKTYVRLLNFNISQFGITTHELKHGTGRVMPIGQKVDLSVGCVAKTL